MALPDRLQGYVEVASGEIEGSGCLLGNLGTILTRPGNVRIVASPA